MSITIDLTTESNKGTSPSPKNVFDKSKSGEEIIFTFPNAQFYTNYSGEKSKNNSKTFDK